MSCSELNVLVRERERSVTSDRRSAPSLSYPSLALRRVTHLTRGANGSSELLSPSERKRLIRSGDSAARRTRWEGEGRPEGVSSGGGFVRARSSTEGEGPLDEVSPFVPRPPTVANTPAHPPRQLPSPPLQASSLQPPPSPPPLSPLPFSLLPLLQSQPYSPLIISPIPTNTAWTVSTLTNLPNSPRKSSA